MKGESMKKYSYTATRDFTQSYMITVEAKNEVEAASKVYALRYNYNNEWSDIERCAVLDPAKNKEV